MNKIIFKTIFFRTIFILIFFPPVFLKAENNQAQIINEINVNTQAEGEGKIKVKIENEVNNQKIEPVELERKGGSVNIYQKIEVKDNKPKIEREINFQDLNTKKPDNLEEIEIFEKELKEDKIFNQTKNEKKEELENSEKKIEKILKEKNLKKEEIFPRIFLEKPKIFTNFFLKIKNFFLKIFDSLSFFKI